MDEFIESQEENTLLFDLKALLEKYSASIHIQGSDTIVIRVFGATEATFIYSIRPEDIL